MSEASLLRNNSAQRRVPLFVGVGASTGGLNAFREMLAALDDALDLKIVFVQHQERVCDALRVELLSRSTSRSVVSIVGRTKVNAGTVYVCPAWTLLEFRNGVVRMTGPEDDNRPNAPIDYFLQSLAAKQCEQYSQHYKPNMLARRIRRRIQVLKNPNIETYVSHLIENPDEPPKLFRELLISVKAFFRDPAAFDVLSQSVIPELFASRRSEDVVRIWVPGCATGEEAFTMPILCREAMDRLRSPPEVQIFATDIDERALASGRSGVYPVTIEEDVSANRLKRFFVRRGRKYQIVKEVLELVLFSVHNLINGPPFSRQDLNSCRNFPIYPGAHLQKKLIPLFHYARRPSGILMLGPSEDIASHSDLFRIIDAKHRIARRKGTGLDAKAALPLAEGSVEAFVGEVRRPLSSTSDTTEALFQVMQRIVLDEFAPKSVIVEEDGKIVCASADMHHYLTVSSVGFQNNVFTMARIGLRIGLRSALQEAKYRRGRVVHDNLSVRINGQLQRVMLTVQPMPKIGDDAELFLVVFRDCGLPLVRDITVTHASDVNWSESGRHTSDGTDSTIAHLERELASTREDLERSIQEYETTNEELKASNEELRSLNEKMQAANEELETSKEEIQTGIMAIAKAHSDLENLFQSTQIATLFLDVNENLIRFTPAARDLYNLTPGDVGRPLGLITHNVVVMPPVPSLADLTSQHNCAEQEIQSLNGRWFLRRVLPYFHDGKADGVILTFIDISERRSAELEVQERVNQLNLALDSGQMGLWEWDISADHVTWSSHLYDAFGFTETTFQPTKSGFLSVIHPDDRQQLELLIRSAFSSSCTNHEVEFRVIRGDNGKTVWAHSRGKIRRNADGEPASIVSVAVDITERKRRELALSFLADLHGSLALLGSAEAIVGKAGQSVAEYLKLSHLMIIRMDEHAAQATVEFDHCSHGSPSLLGVYDMAEFATDDERQSLAAGLPLVIDDTTASTQSFESIRNLSALNIGAILNAPSSRDQRLSFMLCATKQQPHVWREDEIDLVRELANILRLKLDRASAESALRESEVRFRDLADNISQFAWMTDATGSIFWYNQRWFDYTGTTLEQMQDWGWQAVQHPLHLDRVVNHWRESLASGKVWEDIFPLRSKDGEYRWFLSRAQPISDEAGNIVRWFGTNTDITETRQAEEQLAGSRERLTMAMTSARMGSYEWEPASDRVLWDEQHLAITGLKLAEMKGSDFLKLVHPDDMESNRLAIERTVNGECDYDTEFRIVRADGQIRWLAARGKIVPATVDRPLRFVGMNWDITEQKNVDEVVRRGEARLQRIIDGASVGVAFAKTSGEVSRANDATLKILGIARRDFERNGFNWMSRIRKQQRPAAEAIAQQILLTGRMDPCEMTIAGENDAATSVLISSRAVDAETAEHVVFLVDLTQQKMYEQSLHQARTLAEAANQSKSEFIANMSHEIRTPMTAVLGFADLLAADEDNPQKLLYLQTIKRNGSFLLDIINDILDLSKIEAGKMEILTERFPVQSVIADVRSMMEIRATEKGLNFVVKYQEKIPAEIQSDPKRLRQILVNLIGNAIKFTESGDVTLVVRFIERDGGQIHFCVTDTGIGITAEQQQRLFQPFSQGDASVTRSFGGTGLGLSISRRLARFLGGDIVLRSEPGAGSTFSFAIAVGNVSGVQRIDATASIESKAKTTATDYRLNCHVLIVDDRRDVRFLSRRLLTRAGAMVTEAEDGLEAVEFVKGSAQSRTEFDLVLLDMQMPRMDGYQAATILRQTGFSGPIIALTADAMHGDMKHCLECGCDDYLSKPIDSDALLEMVFKHTQCPPGDV